MSVNRPAAMVTLRLRFQDESVGKTPPGPVTAASLVKRGGVAELARRGGVPFTVSSGLDDGATHTISVVPRRAQVSPGTSREAGTYEIVFSWIDLPLDPRYIKAAAVEIHIGTISPEDHRRAMTARGAASLRKRGRLSCTLMDGSPNGNTLVLVGVVDDMETEHSGSGSTVRMAGRDLSGLLLDEPVPGGVIEEIDLSQDIGAVARQLLSYHPHGATIVPYISVASDDRWPDGKVPVVVPKPARSRKGADGKRKKPRHRGPIDPGDLNFWDALTRYCQLCAATCYFVGQELRIAPAKSLYEQAGRSGKGRTPFSGGGARVLPSGETLLFRRLRYGRELDTLKFRRSLGGVRAQPVEAVSVDDTSSAKPSGRIITGRWPPNGEGAGGALRSSETPGGEAGQKVLRVPVPGVRDVEQLQQIARAIYETVMRGELEATFATREMSSTGGGEYDLDLLRLRPGDAVEFLVDTAGVGSIPPLASSLTTMAAAPRGRAVDKVAAAIGNRSVAEVIVRSWRGESAKLQNVLHIEGVDFAYDADRGLTISGGAKSYIEIEVGVAEQAPPAAKSGRSGKPKRKGKLYSETPESDPVVVDQSIGMSLVGGG